MSLRARLLVGMGVIGLVLILAAVVITRTTRSHLIDQVDDQLRSSNVPGRLFVVEEEQWVVGPQGELAPAPRPNSLSALYVGFLGADGVTQTLVLPNLSDEPAPAPLVSLDEALAAAETGDAFTVPSDGSDLDYRMIATVDDRLHGLVLLGLPLDSVDATITRLIVLEVVITGVVLAVLALVTSWVTRLGVRPIKQMTATATAIAGGDLSQRVPDTGHGTEAAELGQALNQMMHNIQEAFDERSRSETRLRQFVADASHELRTPVTTIRGYAELYRSGGLSEESELGEAMRRTEQEAVRMGRLVDDMLLLARLDQGRPLERAPVDLAQLAKDAVRDARAVEPDRPITVDADAHVSVMGDESRLRQVVANLVGNALVHTPRDAPVEVRTSIDGDRGVLEVTDQGAGMSADVAKRVFERFYRADPSRSRHRGGTGLGLSIVQATVRAHGGDVHIDTAPGQGTKFRVELPLR